MSKHAETDYQTYREIMGELLQPIASAGLADETLRRLYESKIVYLENLRLKCFREINDPTKASHFTSADYQLILTAIQQTKEHLRDVVMVVIHNNLNKRQAS